MTSPVDARYAAALRAIWDRSSYDRGFISNPFAGDDVARLGLRRTERLLERFGRPHRAYPILHVAGSKGKGSTCAFAAGVLTAAGYRTGLTTSPHLHSFRERIAVDGAPIDVAAFAALVERAVGAAEAMEASEPELGRVTAFELLTAMALDHFAAVRCDAAVVEVGLGGLLDASNVVVPAASVITTLDYEHTEVLGSTLAEIAANKAGIVKPGVPVATAALPDEALTVVAGAVARNGSRWLLAGRDWERRGGWRRFDVTGPWGAYRDLRSALPGDHQADNAALAVAGLWLGYGDRIDERAVRNGLAAVRWPGRFEVVHISGETIVLDGAHTPAAARALAQTIAVEFPDQRPAIVLGVLRGKDARGIAAALAPIASAIVAVSPPGPRSLPADELAAAVSDTGVPVKTSGGIASALQLAAGPLCVVTGSLTTVAAARVGLGLGTADPDPAG